MRSAVRTGPGRRRATSRRCRAATPPTAGSPDFEVGAQAARDQYPGLREADHAATHRRSRAATSSASRSRANPPRRTASRSSWNIGTHHAREWPSARAAARVGLRPAQRKYGKDARATRLVDATRDDRRADREPGRLQRLPRGATPGGASYTALDLEYRRKNCRVAPGATATLDCDDAAGARPASTSTATTAGSGAARARARTRRTTRTAARGPASEPEVAGHPRAHRDAPDHEPDHQPHVLEPRAAPAGRGGGGCAGRRAAVPRARPARGHERLREHPVVPALRHDRRDRGLVVLERPAATASRSRSATRTSIRSSPTAVVGEYLGREPAAGAGKGGNREAYYRMLEATATPRTTRDRGEAPKGCDADDRQGVRDPDVAGAAAGRRRSLQPTAPIRLPRAAGSSMVTGGDGAFAGR